jgi:uncharacterized protein YceK
LKNLTLALIIAALGGCSTSATADKGTTDLVIADGTTPTTEETTPTTPTTTTTLTTTPTTPASGTYATGGGSGS